MPHKIPSLRSTKGMDALPLRRPRSPILLDWASERGWLRTPHLFARAFFVHLSRFFAAIFERKNGVSPECGSSGQALQRLISPPAFGGVRPWQGLAHPAFGCCQSLDGELLQKLAQFVAGAMTLRYTQLGFLCSD